jgi:hypothetical protein
MSRKIYRVAINGPINGRWFATPLNTDGTTGESSPFATREQALEWAAYIDGSGPSAGQPGTTGASED